MTSCPNKCACFSPMYLYFYVSVILTLSGIGFSTLLFVRGDVTNAIQFFFTLVAWWSKSPLVNLKYKLPLEKETLPIYKPIDVVSDTETQLINPILNKNPATLITCTEKINLPKSNENVDNLLQSNKILEKINNSDSEKIQETDIKIDNEKILELDKSLDNETLLQPEETKKLTVIDMQNKGEPVNTKDKNEKNIKYPNTSTSKSIIVKKMINY